MLSRLCGPKGVAGGHCVAIYTVHWVWYYWGKQNFENEMSGACSMCGKGENCI